MSMLVRSNILVVKTLQMEPSAISQRPEFSLSQENRRSLSLPGLIRELVIHLSHDQHDGSRGWDRSEMLFCFSRSI